MGIEENNLPIPNAAEWELKCQRTGASSLTILIHCEPSPRAIKFVSKILLQKYRWKHKEAGKKYPKTEMSFCQTISCLSYSSRGFCVKLDKTQKKIIISFNSKRVDEQHFIWLKSIKEQIGLKELSPQPYWGFDDIFYKVGAKLSNCFYIEAEVKKGNKKEIFK